MQEYANRKRLRLSGWNYSAPGLYFITVCTQERRCFLSDIDVGAIHESPAVVLSSAGEIVRQIIESLPERFPEICVEKYVIMPNHIHLLLKITAARALREAPLQEEGRRSLLSEAVGYLKMNSSKRIRMTQPKLAVWQRSYHDHVVRGEADLREIWAYIDGNPAKWAENRFYPDAERPFPPPSDRRPPARL